MILRDPVHGLVTFEGERERVVAALLRTREVQRLRRVRQLGLASLVFPGAEHSRFAHALGAAHVMSRLLDRLGPLCASLAPEQRIDDEAARDALAAALLHDLGHGPYSHLFEYVLPGAPRHERWTERFLLDAGSEVHAALERLGQGSAERVARLVFGEHRLSYLGHAVSGTLDVDRCDYLLRDSHMTGVRYGIYDLDWLLRALSLGVAPSGEPVLAVEGRKGLPPLEGFFLARNFMYQQVYHHKAVRAAEVLVRAILLRASELLREGHELPAVPAALLSAARGDPVQLGDYFDMDDARLSHALSSFQYARDPLLADLAQRFFSRVLPKTLPLPDAPEGPELSLLWQSCHERAAEVAARSGFRPELYVWLDLPSDVPYAEPDVADEEVHDRVLWVSLRHRPMTPLGDVSFLLRQLRNKRTVRPRLVFPGELREAIGSAVEPLLAQAGLPSAGPGS
ncbi:MAG TPA: HD domain-containing protein [Polyangiales bacterium]